MGRDDRLEKLRTLLDRVKRRAAEPRVHASAVAARPEPDAELEVVEEELVDDMELEMLGAEMVDEPAAAEDEAASEVTLDDLEEEEEAPESAPRPAASAGAGLGDGAADDAREEPLKTPPPESGRQELTPPPPAQSPALEADASRGRVGQPRSGPGPTAEQLGEVFELEGGEAHVELELDKPPPIPSPAVPKVAPPAAASPLPPAAPAPAATSAGPQRFERPPPPTASPASFEGQRAAAAPATFLELLDASLGL